MKHVVRLCTECLRDGNETPVDGRWKQCEPCRWKQRKRKARNKASNDAWRARNSQKVQGYRLAYQERQRLKNDTGGSGGGAEAGAG